MVNGRGRVIQLNLIQLVILLLQRELPTSHEELVEEEECKGEGGLWGFVKVLHNVSDRRLLFIWTWARSLSLSAYSAGAAVCDTHITHTNHTSR